MKYIDLIKEVLREQSVPKSAKEIAELLFNKGHFGSKKGKPITPEQIRNRIRKNPDTDIQTSKTSPYTYSLIDSKSTLSTIKSDNKDQGSEDSNSKITKPEKYVDAIKTISNDLFKDIVEIVNTDPKDTQKETLILARLGQGKYRSELINIWNGCSISGYSDISLLVASHIKPWSHSTNGEKLDPYNGFLLLPNYDKLFDKGLISFDDKGGILISSMLVDTEKLGISTAMEIRLKEKNKPYLTYHREKVFRGNESSRVNIQIN